MKETTIVPLGVASGEIQIVYLNAVLMPNGEIISKGKTLGFFDKYKGYVFIAINQHD